MPPNEDLHRQLISYTQSQPVKPDVKRQLRAQNGR